MKALKTFIKYLLIVFLILCVAVAVFIIVDNSSRDSDATYELRGWYKPTQDGKTYLVIEDDNGGECGPLLVDKKEWLHGLGSEGEVEFGTRTIECGTVLSITVQEGTVYYLNYWGP